MHSTHQHAHGSQIDESKAPEPRESRSLPGRSLLIAVVAGITSLLGGISALPAGADPVSARLVRDICPGVCSAEPWRPTIFNGILYFSADDGVHGRELWRSDGTEAGTFMVRDIQAGPIGSLIYVAEAGPDAIYFSALTEEYGFELWKSDGTEQGTRLVADIWPGGSPTGEGPGFLTKLGPILCFEANDGIHGRELWQTDGTAAGTYLVKDIRPGPASGVGMGLVRFFRSKPGEILLHAGDGIHGSELWTTDCTAAGTRMVADIYPGPPASDPNIQGQFDGLVYLQANEGIHGREPWRTDGTAIGTALVADIRPGPEGSNSGGLATLGRFAYFTADDGVSGGELWRTDGTSAGTRLVKDIEPGPQSSEPRVLARLDDLLVLGAFTAEHGIELWRTDGSTKGTTLIRDIEPGAPNGLHLWGQDGEINWASQGGKLYFVGWDEDGQEPWVTSGSGWTTYQLADLAAGPASSSPRRFLLNGTTLFFTSDDGIHGEELWAMDLEVEIFQDDFESGDVSAWLSAVP